MQSKPFRSLALPIIAGLLLGYYIGFERPEKTTEAQVTPAPELLPGLVPDSIVRVEMRTATRRLLLVKKADGWNVLAPKKVPASAREVRRLLSLLCQSRYERSLSPAPHGDALQEFGLKPPSLVLNVTSLAPKTQQQTLQTLFLGTASPSGRYIYAMPGTRTSLLLVDSQTIDEIKYFLFEPPYLRKTR